MIVLGTNQTRIIATSAAMRTAATIFILRIKAMWVSFGDFVDSIAACLKRLKTLFVFRSEKANIQTAGSSFGAVNSAIAFAQLSRLSYVVPLRHHQTN
jgi:hypothetical protein